MDLRMRWVDGIEATRRLAGSPPVLALTTFNEDELLSAALRAGATGFVLKDSSAEELIRAVRAVAKGDSYLDPAVTARVLTAYRKAAPGPGGTAITELTTRELDVLTLIGRGLSNAEIAATHRGAACSARFSSTYAMHMRKFNTTRTRPANISERLPLRFSRLYRATRAS
jgi:DNA-binding NarL/FixJ family response regulator